MIRFLFLGLVIFLASCQAPIKTPSEPSDQIPFAKPTLDLDAKLNHLQNQRNSALRKRDWAKYILLTEQIWQASSFVQKPLIEEDAWFELQEVKISEQEFLIQHQDSLVKSWGWLLEARQQQGLNFKRMVEDIAEISTDVSFKNHLIPVLTNHYHQLGQSRTLAVLLPMSAQYAAIGEEIKAGILQAYWHESSQHQLLFFDTQEFSSIEQAYLAAVNAGAQTILGPLIKEQVAEISELNPANLVALNYIEKPTNFWQLSHKNIYEAFDITELLQKNCLTNLAIFGAETTENIKMAKDLQAAWEANRQINFYSYDQRNPNLRLEMGKMLHANLSQERAAHLSRSLEQPIEFFPRPREDLDAIVLLDNEKQVSVLRPQFDYFNVSLPLFGSSKLTPANLFATAPNRDMKTIIIPAFNAALAQTPVKNSLQAFGWDGYQLAVNQPLLAPGLSYRGTLATHFLTQDNIIHSKHAWARFSNSGQIEPLNPEKFSSLGLEPAPVEIDLLKRK